MWYRSFRAPFSLSLALFFLLSWSSLCVCACPLLLIQSKRNSYFFYAAKVHHPSLRSDSCKLGPHFHMRDDWIKQLETPRLIINLTHIILLQGELCCITTAACVCVTAAVTHSFPRVGQEWGRNGGTSSCFLAYLCFRSHTHRERERTTEQQKSLCL